MLRGALSTLAAVLLCAQITSAQTTPARANDFLNTIGIGAKTVQGDPYIADANGLAYLGARWYRDDFTHDQNALGQLISQAQMSGTKVQEISSIDDGQKPVAGCNVATNDYCGNLADTLYNLHQFAAAGVLKNAEAPNEPNNFGGYYVPGDSCGRGGGGPYIGCVHEERDLHAAMQADPTLKKYLLIGLSEPGGEPDDACAQDIECADAHAEVPFGTIEADAGNSHAYVNTATTGCYPVDNQTWDTFTAGYTAAEPDIPGEYWGSTTWAAGYPIGDGFNNTIPKATTETGWNRYECPSGTPGNDITMQGKLLAPVFLDAWSQGWLETAIYELFERCPYDCGYGFFNENLTNNESFDPAISTTYNPSVMAAYAQPDAVYLHNLTTILADNSSNFAPAPISIIFPNQLPAAFHYLLLQKSSGIYELAAWNEAYSSNVSEQVAVTLPSQVAGGNVYDIEQSSAPVNTFSTANYSFSIPAGDVQVLEFNVAGRMGCSPQIYEPQARTAVTGKAAPVDLTLAGCTDPTSFVRIYVDSSIALNAGGAANRIDTTGYTNGKHSLSATVWDRAGLIVEGTAPEVPIGILNAK